MRRITIIIAIALMLFPTALNAQQKNDDFFRAGDEFNDNRLPTGVIIGVMQNDNPTPLGSGLLIMTAVGAGYAIIRRKRNIKNDVTLLLTAMMLLGMTQCKKNNIATISDGDTVFMTLEASCGGGRTIFDPNVPGIR